MRIDRFKWELTLCFIILISGCGGGGGSEAESGLVFNVTVSELDITRLDSGEAVTTEGTTTIRSNTLRLSESP